METTRRDAVKRMGAVLLAGFIPLTGIGSAPASRSFTGEEMYRGIFFAEGDFARLIPEIQSLKATYVATQTSDAKLRETRRQIIQELSQTDAAFFSKFKSAMMSQDVVCVQHQLQLASDRTVQTLDTLYNSPTAQANGYQLKKQMNAEGQGVVLVVYNVVACVNVLYILSAAILPVTPPEEELMAHQKTSPLFMEQLALSICSVARKGA